MEVIRIEDLFWQTIGALIGAIIVFKLIGIEQKHMIIKTYYKQKCVRADTVYGRIANPQDTVTYHNDRQDTVHIVITEYNPCPDQ